MLTHRLRTGIDAYESGKLVKLLLKEMKEQNTAGGKLPKPTSMATYVSELKGEKATWWKGSTANQKLGRNALASILETTPQKLGLEPDAPGHMDFAEFADLRGIDVTRQSPPTLGKPDLYGLDPHGECAWIVMPRGFGRSTALRYYELREEAATFQTRDLATVEPELPPMGRVIIEFDGGDPNLEEARAVRRMARRGDVVVLATRPYSVEKEGSESGELADTESDYFFEETVEDITGWRTSTWRPESDWVDRLVTWSVGLLQSPSCLRAAGSRKTIVDGLEAWDLATGPGSVLSLLEYAHAWGVPGFDERLPGLLSSHLLEIRILDRCGRSDTTAAWLAPQAHEVLLAILLQRLRTPDLPLFGPLSRNDWDRLARDASPPENKASIKELVREARNNDDLADDDRLEAWIDRRVTSRRPTRVIDRLINAGVLSSLPDGRLELHPTWMSEHLSLDVAKAEVGSQPPAEWAMLLIEPERHDLLRRALIQLVETDEPAVDQVVDAALAAFDAREFGSVLAVGFLLDACVTGWWRTGIDPKAFLEPLLHSVSTVLVSADERVLATPPSCLLAADHLGHERWLRTCWICSLWLPPPSEAPILAGPWLWPGRVDPLEPTTMPGPVRQVFEQVSIHGLSFDRAGARQRLFEDFVDLVPGLVERMNWTHVDPESLTTVAEPFRPYYLLHLLHHDIGAFCRACSDFAGYRPPSWFTVFEELLAETPDQVGDALVR